MQENGQPTGISLHAGFPNPAGDKTLGGLDLNQLLIQNRTSTFMFRLRGGDWERYGIFDHDIAIVDRALDPRKSDLVVWWDEATDHFAISKCQDAPSGATTWGVVTTVIHQFCEYTT